MVLCPRCRESEVDAATSLVSLPSWQSLLGMLMAPDGSRPSTAAVTMSALLVSACLTVSLAAIKMAEVGAAAHPFGEIQDMVLVYVSHQEGGSFTQERLSPYVSYLDQSGSSGEWLFDSFLFLSLSSGINANFWTRSTATDWTWWIEKLFAKDEQIDALNKEIDRVRRVLGKPSRRGVIVSIPYPDPSVENFGMRSTDGTLMRFSPNPDRELSARHRLEACEWFVDEIVGRYRARSYNNLELLGFYWLQEELRDGDAELINALADHLHGKGYQLFWIPYNSEDNIEALRTYRRGELSFDWVWIQPNYVFARGAAERWRELRDLDQIARTAHELGVSIEIEMNRDEFLKGEVGAVNDFYAYLDGGLTHLYIDKPLAYYVFPYDMYHSRIPIVRQSYDALCRFVKGRHEPVTYFLHLSVGGPHVTSSASIYLESQRQWGPAQEMAGHSIRVALPEATFSISRLDPDKDMVVAVRYLTYQEGGLEMRIGGEWEPVGSFVADGKWRTSHFRLPLAGTGSKSATFRITDITWVSDIWSYPDEAIFRLGPPDPSNEFPGLIVEATKIEEVWMLGGGDEVVFLQADPKQEWLLGLTYKSDAEVGMTVVADEPVQTVTLSPATGWESISVLVSPRQQAGGMLFRFDRALQIKDMWVSKPRLSTNVGTAWDSAVHRHNPGVCIGSGWSAPRETKTEPRLTYRLGESGSTLIAHAPDAVNPSLITMAYRSKTEVEISMAGSGLVLGHLPQADQWQTASVTIPAGALGPVFIELGSAVELAQMWLEVVTN